MESNPDPALAFWPDTALDSIDLYATLNLNRTATEAEIKSAYRRGALLSHPDKLPPTASEVEILASQLRFQRISYAYNVLKDEKRRKRYDDTGRTDEGRGIERSEDEWREYFKELWTGQINAETIDQFKKEYQGSEEELSDLLEAYDVHSGDLESISNHIMCSTIEDEPRFISLINKAIQDGRLRTCKKWTTSSKNLKARTTRINKANKEANEAEAYAKELGVHDQLYNSAGGKGKKERGTKGKETVKGKGNSQREEEVDGDLDGLKALIQGRQANRMESLMESLEAKYGAGAAGKKKGGKKRSSKEFDDEDEGEKGTNKKGKKKVVEEEMSEEDFLKARAAIDARAAKGRSKK
ncbi:BQ5605_C022g09498 [Microbotryum silenes-dioicae]|uniref:BQ5605_C022g09498 protein n=1 Tax=Microbotryum silenes-dioicae TaxID=796604 RepID=A0A2X0MP11_9BASI|nr:BQ5605_C022g09498 [Microbotryum silenes-dioicae]